MVHCWTARYESLGHAGIGEALVSEAESWDGDGETLWDHLTALCLLEDGHEGEHEFTPPGDITITFAPAGAEDGAG